MYLDLCLSACKKLTLEIKFNVVMSTETIRTIMAQDPHTQLLSSDEINEIKTFIS